MKGFKLSYDTGSIFTKNKGCDFIMRNMILAFFMILGLGFLGLVAGCGGGEQPATTTTTSTTTTTLLYSISGQVNFVTTNAGIKDGVDISVIGPVTKTATADSSTGTYEVTGLPVGYYTLLATKENWTIPNITAEITSSNIASKNFSAAPTNFDVDLTTFSGVNLNKIGSGESGIVMIIPTSGSTIRKSLDGGQTWSTASVSAESLTLYEVMEGGTAGTFVTMDSQGRGWLSSNTTDWAVAALITLEAPSVYCKSYSFAAENTAEAVGTNGKLYHTDNQAVSFSESCGGTTGLKSVCAWRDGSHKIIAVGDSVVKYYDGSLWTSPTTSRSYNDVDRYPSNSVVVISNERIYVGNLADLSFTLLLGGVPYNMNGIYCSLVSGKITVVGDNGLYLKSK
jgi:hypothetical protein